MSETATTISGKKVIKTESITCKLSNNIVIIPFVDSPAYKLEFRLGVTPDDTSAKANIAYEDGIVVVSYDHKWDLVNEAIINNVVIASGGDTLYYMNYHVKLIGDRQNPSVFLAYTIYSD